MLGNGKEAGVRLLARLHLRENGSSAETKTWNQVCFFCRKMWVKMVWSQSFPDCILQNNYFLNISYALRGCMCVHTSFHPHSVLPQWAVLKLCNTCTHDQDTNHSIPKITISKLRRLEKFKEYVEETLIKECFLQLNKMHSDIHIFLEEINIGKLLSGSWGQISLWHCYFKCSVKDS